MNYVRTSDIQDAVSGQEGRILDALKISGGQGTRHIDCPYPSHGGRDDWRWDVKKAKAFCTCTTGDSIFDVIMKCEGLASFEEAKLRATSILGRTDLIRSRDEGQRFQATDAATLLAPPFDCRDDSLVAKYLGHRLNIAPDLVVVPDTPFVGWKALTYYDPPAEKGHSSRTVGEYPCAVFGTVGVSAGRHAHRICLAPEGRGKADLGSDAQGKARDPKNSARKRPDDETAGRSVLWGNPAQVSWIIVAEGIETAAAVALAFREQIMNGTATVAAAITAVGVEAFQVWPSTTRVTVAADRDEAPKEDGRAPTQRGERAARLFGLRHHRAIGVAIALPGASGQAKDWLDVLTTEGIEAVREGILAAPEYEPTQMELAGARSEDTCEAELAAVQTSYPLRAPDTLPLVYKKAASGKVMVHKRINGKGDSESIVPVATPFGIPARLRFVDRSNTYGLRIAVQDMDGEPREIDVDRSMLCNSRTAEIMSPLLGAGLRIELDGDRIVLACLRAAHPDTEILVVCKPGWHKIMSIQNQLFVCPDGEVIGAPNGLLLELSASSRVSPPVARGGTLDGWKAAVAAAFDTHHCEHWALSVFAGFAGPLVSLTGLDTLGINFSGLTSAGKTLGQRLAVSAWTQAASCHPDSLLQTAKSTASGLEIAASRSIGTVFALDELAHIEGRKLAELIYTLAGGVGKVRATPEMERGKTHSWSTFVILSAENSLEEKVRDDGGVWQPGMAVRMPDVDVTLVNRFVDKEIIAKIETVDCHFGHAGPAFVKAIFAAGLHQKPSDCLAKIKELASQLAGPESDSAVSRAAMPFAVLSMAGSLAQEYGLIPETVDVSHVIDWAWTRFSQSTDAMALNPEQQVITNLRTWIAERWGSSIHPVYAEGINRNAVGWYDDDTVYLLASQLREAAGGSLKEIQIAKALSSQNLLMKRKDKDCYFVSYVPKIGYAKAYALRRSEFGRVDTDE